MAAPSFFVQFYFLSFATDVLLLSPVVVGALLAGGPIWDAVSDPLVGYGSDRTSSRWGRWRRLATGPSDQQSVQEAANESLDDSAYPAPQTGVSSLMKGFSIRLR